MTMTVGLAFNLGMLCGAFFLALGVWVGGRDGRK